MSGLPRVTLISYGGTIASVVQPGVGASPSLDIGEMARAIPGMAAVARIDSRPSRPVASPNMTFADLFAIARAAREAVEAGADGVVLTQGTDTLEEIAFGLDLLWGETAPLVVTGAMRNASLPGADGPANVLAAVRVAASSAARGLGALVVMNEEIHAARFVRKTHAQSPATFRSPHTGPIGWLAEQDVRILTRPHRLRQVVIPALDGQAHPSLADGEENCPPVCLLKMLLGDDGRLLPGLADLGFKGLVLEAFGGGHLTRAIAESDMLESVMAAMPVVLASRTGNGEVLRGTYGGFPGSEIDLIQRGLIFAGALDGPKARILLTLLLMDGADRGEIARVFAEVGPLTS